MAYIIHQSGYNYYKMSLCPFKDINTYNYLNVLINISIFAIYFDVNYHYFWGGGCLFVLALMYYIYPTILH